jgi:hypothetical protein
VRQEKLCIVREESRIQALFDAGEVDLGIFNIGMITMNEDSGGSEKQQKRDLSELG